MFKNLNYAAVWRSLDDLAYGLGLALSLAVISIILGSLIGIVVAFSLTSKKKHLRIVSNGYVTGIRNIPLMIIVLFIYFGLPDIGLLFGQIESFIFALTIYAGAYLAEVFRGGLISIPVGITEAGMASGMSNLQINMFIKLPILLRSVMPALSNNFTSLFKDTSIASVIAVQELTFQIRKINLDTFRTIEAWSFGTLIYVFVCIGIASILRIFERRLAIPR